ncbi:beta-glucosidase BglX [Streptomyces sp. N2-109]|uniref:beta-glucosidase n=1 Tax=Streptomyces gossypii TaxID=2883101 RepID=A0ABT2JSZ7_9ACTN|nr:beta-glucosidase BglX [Streptomyces gossypii]MCT2591000.1 beta-glucosidase BglX [Streptomyces gossypii]
MTVAEKLGQLQQLPWTDETGPGGADAGETERKAREGLLGSVLNLHGARATNALQRIAVEESRLGIPLVFGLDVIHGFWTTFPIPLAAAASFDPGLVRTEAGISAREARSNGVHWTFAPMMDVTREPRWGRIAEGSGEDPYLTAEFAAAKVRGYQGGQGDEGRGDLASRRRLAACAKHFVGYGGAEGGRDYNTVDVSEQRLRNVFLPPFKASVDSGAATVMASFNTLSGVPAHGDAHTLTDILKTEWDFDGVVVSDWTGIAELIPHGFAADGEEAARLALNAGVDMEMTSTLLAEHGEKLVGSGAIPRGRLDDAVARVLRLKFRLGLFEDPYAAGEQEITGPTGKSRAAAREAAARSMVLLKNTGGVLPLARTVGSLALVGPFADSDDLLGAWSFPGAEQRYRSVTVLEAVREALPDAEINHAAGTDAAGEGTEGIAEAVAAAEAAEVTVVVVGEAPALSGEAASRSDLSLPGAQESLIEAIGATGKPYAVVLVNGRPLVLGDWLERAPAVLEAWHGGIEAGNALADVLFGEVAPGGKLPVSFPRDAGQVPVYYSHENTGRPYGKDGKDDKYTSKYLDLPHGPRFPFGHGLSYTRFETGRPRLTPERISASALREGATVEVAVVVRNTGDREGDEVVQLYVHDVAARIVQPVRRLRGFRRVALKADDSTTVRFRLSADDLGFWTNDSAGGFVVEPGRIDVYAGSSSETEAKRSLTIT